MAAVLPGLTKGEFPEYGNEMKWEVGAKVSGTA